MSYIPERNPRTDNFVARNDFRVDPKAKISLGDPLVGGFSVGIRGAVSA